MAAMHWKASAARAAPTLLTEALASPCVDDRRLLQVLSVHVHGVSIDPSLDGRRFRLCVGYGEKGSQLTCKTHGKRSVAPTPDAQADASQQKQKKLLRRLTMAVDESAMFLWSEARQPMITVHLLEIGLFCSRAIAETELDLTELDGLRSKLSEESIVLRATRGRPGEIFGQARVSFSLREVRKGELLSQLRPLGFRMKSNGALLVRGGLQ